MTALPTTLADDLGAFFAEFRNRVPSRIQAIMAEADAALASDFKDRTVLAPGDQAPDFALPSAQGRTTRLSDLLTDGPVIVSFYRGGWCPYCNLELRAYQALLPEIEAAGAQLVAISPQSPDESLSTAEKNALGFEVLSDTGSDAARAYGLAFALPQALRDIYSELGHSLPMFNATADWTLPVPATFVIGRDRKVLLAHVDTDYRHRLEPRAALYAIADAQQPA